MDAMNRWAWLVNNTVTNDLQDVTVSEVTAARKVLVDAKGAAYVKRFLKDGNAFRAFIDSDDVGALARIVSDLRARTKVRNNLTR